MSCQGLTLDDVIPNGRSVCLRNVSNHLSGGETITLQFDDVHHSYIDLVERACQSIKGLYFCGVDMVIQDIAKPATPDNHWFLELNSTPGTPAFYYPWAGDVVDVSAKILNMLKTHYPFND
jgi:D-alanine-D-alanine ligase-like ATP-grasp enzyme